MKNLASKAITALILVAAVAAVGWRYSAYLSEPWTRNGQVRAKVIEIAPRVTGPIVELAVVDNQRVSAGDLLFRIDRRTFEARLRQAQAQLNETIDTLTALERQVEAAQAQVTQVRNRVPQAESQVASAQANLDESARNLQRAQGLLDRGDIAQARFDAQKRAYDVDVASKDRADAALLEARAAVVQAQADLAAAVASRGKTGDDNAQLQAARSALEEARLDLEFTEQRAPVDGFVTNLTLGLGSFAAANQPVMALVDEDSFWIDAYFRETFTGRMRAGDPAYVTLMSYPDQVIEAKVDSIAWGIAKSDGSTGGNLLPNVQPTFEWIRLAQRIPVRIELGELPEGVELRVGTTASVLVSRDGTAPPPAPSLLQ